MPYLIQLINPTATRMMRVDRSAPDCSFNPRENDNLGTLSCWLDRYKISDKGEEGRFDPAAYHSFHHLLHCEFKPRDLVLPVSFSEERGEAQLHVETLLPEQWEYEKFYVDKLHEDDISGVVYVRAECLAKEFGCCTDNTRNIAIESIEVEMKQYANYLSGDIFSIHTFERDKIGKPWEEVDCVAGYIADGPEDALRSVFGDELDEWSEE